MSAKQPINVVLLWHMHQPDYRNLRTGQYVLPWTYFHAIKDYVDMATHLEANPEARAVVNFVPTLLEQIDDYAQQIKDFFKHGSAIRDPLLDALIEPVLPSSPEQRINLIKQCLRANEIRLIQRFKDFARLAEIAKWLDKYPSALIYIDDQYLVDLLVWIHLAWLGETVRRDDQRIKRLLKQGTGFSINDRNELLKVIGELIGNVIRRYRKLAERGQIELSMTPYAHPIIPLMLDIHSAQEAIPDVSLPLLEHYPDGEQRVRWHIEKGLQVFEDYFGFRPQGCWPSEGSISNATFSLLGEYQFKWIASGESVLRNSLNQQVNNNNNNAENGCLHSPYNVVDQPPVCFFRDDGLSDLIGFNYAKWHADDAVANLIHHLENIAQACQDQPGAIVSIILDGENAWEFYPENGYYFLSAMYKALAEHTHIKLTTYADYLEQHQLSCSLPSVVAGSWVYGTFSTWIGDPDKNRGWDMLGEAKKTYDNVIKDHAYDEAHRQKLDQQMAICEGSDWFWWFGDYNSAESVSDFDTLYRLHLSNLYMLMGVEPPAYLAEAFSHGSGSPEMGGLMRHGKEPS